jgi:hypothetical protein
VNSNGSFVLLSQVAFFLMTTLLDCSDSFTEHFVVICCATVMTCNWEPVQTYLFSGFPVAAAAAAAWGSQNLFPSVHGACGCCCYMS